MAQNAYWLDGTPFCVACVERDAPCMSAEEINRAELLPCISGCCGCCGTAFPATKEEADWSAHMIDVIDAAGKLPGGGDLFAD